MKDLPQDPDRVAQKMVRRARTLTALPEAATRAGRVAEDLESSTEDLRMAFSQDAALCSNLLKVANSALYGLRSKVSSIDHAAVVLGRKVLRNVALAASLQTILPKAEIHKTFSVNNLWRHSLRTAAAAHMLARESRAWEPEQAFAAGLIHDLGLLVEIEANQEVLAGIIKRVEQTDERHQTVAIREFELAAYGADHQHLGAAMCHAWGFPTILASVAAHHHDPFALTPENQALAMIVCLAEEVVGDCEHGVKNARPRPPADPAMLAHLNMDANSFEALVETMIKAADDIEAAF